MLRGYIDESISAEGGRLFVMAGYVATPEKWMAFSDEWASLLSLGPPHWLRLEELKMSSLQGPLGLQQAELFYRVIERHLDTYVACVVRIEDVVAAWSEINWPSWLENADRLRNEYFLGFDLIIRGLAAHSGVIGIGDPIDFIFDEQDRQEEKCHEAWRVMKSMSPPDIKKLLGVKPSFADSKIEMPLQAADLLAYYVRQSEAKYVSDPESKIVFPWEQKKHMHGIVIYQTKAMVLKALRSALLASQLWRAGVHSDQLPAIISPTGSPRLADSSA